MMGVSDAVTRTRCASATPLTESFFDACSSGPTQRSQNRNGFAFYFSRFEAKARGGRERRSNTPLRGGRLPCRGTNGSTTMFCGWFNRINCVIMCCVCDEDDGVT